MRKYYNSSDYLSENSPETVVTDYIASMTDDYFSDLYEYCFPKKTNHKYMPYFD